MDENKPLSEQNNIPFGHNRTNEVIYSEINFKVKSFLHFNLIVIPRFIPHANKAQL